ncbi:hypothetical protein SAMN05443144_11475 [Fodinibius roseus]|uniref:Uncharacterized protein n=1 Tax=Fodinibius roseus TaxID=1194090 RepID=A0A1M5F7K6_9BACT|nr:hypothetical protein [Fodinibius roseus]SHF87041.1 hypothetical protein SAMN05443144_11475 [Fodinibius roseus]
MNLDIPEEQFREILEQIKSDDSPVGIDAGKTHVLILQKLLDIESRLEELEKAFSNND